MSIKVQKKLLIAAMGALLGVSGVANAHVTYNTQANGAGAFPPDGSQAGPWTDGNPSYTGNLPATWVAFIHNAGGSADSQTASSADAGFTIGTGAKAYKDGASNWGHTADYGLFQLHEDATVTITVASDSSGLRPAFGLWSGWDTNSSSSRHQAYLNNGALNPMGSVLGSSLSVVDASAWIVSADQGTATNNASATLTRNLTAGNYTLIIGGYDGTAAGANLAYTATISAAAVPLPGAVWLFASAMVGATGLKRRKQTATV